MAMILLIGGADTGRAPMAAALLRRLLEARGLAWPVESAGVLGHDGDPAEVEARDTMAHMGLDISAHRARMLTDDLVAQAALLLAIDSGTALVLRSRFPAALARVHTLGDLAGRPRDIPDPFRMQIGAWMTYAREIEALLTAAVPRIIELVTPTVEGRADTLRRRGDPGPAVHPAGAEARPAAQSLAERAAAAERITRLLYVAAELPGVVDWAAARAQIEANLHQVAVAPYDASDLVAAYVGLMRAALAMTPAPPSAGQMAALRDAARRLADSIGQDDLNDLSTRLAGWAAL
jgi:protein-tyrosine phosphatase